LQGDPDLVFAPHLSPGQLAPKRHSMPIATLFLISIKTPPILRYYYTTKQ
jgi:hypothetical protein